MMFGPLVSLLAVFSSLVNSSPTEKRISSIHHVPLDKLMALREMVGGRLYHGVPSGVSCFSRYDNGRSMMQTTTDEVSCGQVRANANNGTFISDHFGLYMTPDFGTCISADQGCIMANDATSALADSNATCYQGSIPSYYIDVRQIAHIQAGLKFAQTHKVPLVVKNTGHDYSGRSSGSNSLGLWLHNYRPPFQLHEDFIPEGCTKSSGPAIVTSAGHQFQDAQRFAHKHGYMVLSGVSGSVAASGGWILGGGHSSLSPKLGLGVDSVLQMTAVLPNGTIVTANRCQHKDMFFALRGGGGNSFGILVETIYIAHPEFPVQSVKLSFNYTSKNDTVALLTAHADQWNKDGWGVYIDVLEHTLSLDGTIPYLNFDEAQASLKPLTDFAFSQQNFQVDFTSHADYWSYSQSDEGTNRGSTAIGTSFVVSSRLVQRELFQNVSSRETLNKALSAQDFFITTVGPAYTKLPASDQAGGVGEASITPAWRDTLWFIMLRAEWDSGKAADTEPATVVRNIKKNDAAIQGLRELTPSGGTYFNEAHPYEPDRGRSFWGTANYERLSKIKAEIDPDNLLTCWQCVGFDPNDARFACYPHV